MQELEITWRRVIAIAWLIMWRGAIGGAVIGAVIGFIIGAIIGFVGAMMKVPPDQSKSLVTILAGTAGLVWGLAWYCIVVRMALRKKFSGFRVALVQANPR